MKRILIILLILLLSGCSFQQQNYDDTYEFAKQAAIGYIETVLGYNAELRYELHRIESSEEYPIIYQITINKEPLFHVEFEYGTEIAYGGVNFIYKDGYLYPLVRPIDFVYYTEEQYLFSIPFNEDMEYTEYQNVEIIQIKENYAHLAYERLERIFNEEQLSFYLSDADWSFQQGDQFTLKEPVLHFGIILDQDNKVIVVNQSRKFDYPVYINGELKTVFSIVVNEEGRISSKGFVNVEEYQGLLDSEKKFVLATTRSFYLQEYIITKDHLIPEDIPHPLYIDKAIIEIQKLLN